MTSNQGPPGALTLRSGDSGSFDQTGQVDWVAFLRATAEASISILTRLSGSGVEPLTVLVAQQVCTTLLLSNEGEQNVQQALSRLRVFRSFGDAVWFGLGVGHVTRTLAQTREGLGCVALCASLAETHSADFSASVLSNFMGLNNPPRPLNPSLGQWKRLVEACSGCLAKSSFKDVVRDFMGPYLIKEHGEPRIYTGSNPLEGSDPRNIAEALQGLAKISSGHLDSLVITGGPDCAWLGAVTEWLLGLSVVIESPNDRRTVHIGKHARQNKSPKVKILYTNEATTPPSSLLAVKNVYRINNISDLIRQHLSAGSASLSVRIPWDHALRSTFGDRALQTLARDLAKTSITALGSIAQLFAYVAMAGFDVEQTTLRDNTDYLEGTYGRGLVQSVSRCFPELPLDFASQAIDLVTGTFNDAFMTYEAAMLKISTCCKCERHEQSESVNNTHEKTGQPYPVCIVALLETIIFASRISAGLVVEEGLAPTQSGLVSIYERMVDLDIKPLKKFSIDHQFESSLRIAVQLYSGYCPSSFTPGHQKGVSSVVSRGLCYYLDSLCELSDYPESLSRIHIVPGGIELDERTFPEILDAPLQGPRYPAIQTQIISQIPQSVPWVVDDFRVEAIAMEAESHVMFCYKVSSPRGECLIPPAKLAAWVASARGCIPCSRSRCPRKSRSPPLRILEGEGFVEPSSQSTIRFVAGTGVGWYVALTSALRHKTPPKPTDIIWNNKVILRTEECLSCCVRAMIQYEVDEVISRA